MAKLNLEYYSGENHYSDGDIEEEILRIAREGKQLSELGTVEFPILYHLSPVRENILNWYPFREEGVCLEIGSGCGAISGLLCDRMKKSCRWSCPSGGRISILPDTRERKIWKLWWET